MVTRAKANTDRINLINKLAAQLESLIRLEELNPAVKPHRLKKTNWEYVAIFVFSVDNEQCEIPVYWSRGVPWPDPDQFRRNVAVRLALKVTNPERHRSCTAIRRLDTGGFVT